MSNPLTIIIEVKGGTVTTVTSSHAPVDCVILDYDVQEERDEDGNWISRFEAEQTEDCDERLAELIREATNEA